MLEFSEAHYKSPATKVKNDNKNNGPEDFTEKKWHWKMFGSEFFKDQKKSVSFRGLVVGILE